MHASLVHGDEYMTNILGVKMPLNRIREINEKSVSFIRSDLYPGGEFVPQEEARLSLWDLGFRHGFCVYEAPRAFRGKPWQLKEHLTRFMRSCKACNLEIGMDQNEVERICVEVCSLNEHLLVKAEGEDFGICIEATPGEYGMYGRPLPAPAGRGKPTFIVRNSLIDMKVIARIYLKGIHLVTPSTRAIPPMVMDPKIKTRSRHFQASAIYEAGLMDPSALPLLLDVYGNLAETTYTNILLVYDGVLMTPATCNVLEGINRANAIYLAKQLNLPVIERDLQPFHLYNADEAFISSTSRFISPVSHYNAVKIGKEMPGPITKRLLGGFCKWANYDITGLSFLSKEEKAKFGL